MRFDRLRLRGFQSYEDETIEFPTGTTLISGDQGTGKSTILRGIFSALFQTKSKSSMPDVGSLDEFVRFGETRSIVELRFTVNNRTHDVRWEISASGTDDDRSASTDSCRLETEDKTITGVRSVRSYMIDRLQMTPESFVNSVYVQQKEIRRLLDSDPEQRKTVVDTLLGLDRLKEYKDRMKRARPVATNLRDTAEGRVEEISSQIDEFSQMKDLKDDLRENRRRLNQIRSDLDDLEIEDLRSKQSELETEIEEQKDRRRKRDDMIDRRDKIRSKIQDLRDQRDDLNPGDHDEDDLKRIEESLSELKDEREILRSKRDQIRGSITDHRPNEIEEKRSELRSEDYLIEALDDLRSSYDREKKRFTTELTERRSQLEHIESLDDGVCPVCEQTVEDHDLDREEIEEEIDRLVDKRDRVLTQIDESIEEIEEEIERRRELDDLMEEAEENKRLESRLKDIQSKLSSVEEKINEKKDRRESIQSTIDERSKIDQLKREEELHRDRLSDVLSSLDDIEIREIDEIQSKLSSIEEKISDREDRQRSLRDQEDELSSRVHSIESKIDQLTDLKDRLEEAENRQQRGQETRDQIESIIEGYDDVRREMRSKNIKMLEVYTNELFSELYRDDNYTGVEIGPNYELTMIRSNGHRMTTSLASGGEGAVLNLALRAAIYRVVSEQENELPPLVLDEPTSGMDTRHVRHLRRLIRKIREWGVEQIIVVSHRSELEGLTDSKIEVEIEENVSRTKIRS